MNLHPAIKAESIEIEKTELAAKLFHWLQITSNPVVILDFEELWKSLKDKKKS